MNRGRGSNWRGRKGGWSSNFEGKGRRGTGPQDRGRYFNNFRGGNNFNNSNQWKRQKREAPTKRLSEDEIGITEYITDHEGFNGIIKSRYSDFQVSEINLQGEVAKLTDKNPPQPPAEETVEEDEELLLCKYNVEVLPMDTWDRINALAVCKHPTTEVVEVDASEMSKEQRTKIHDSVKKAFGGSIVGSTVNIDDKKLLRFAKFRKGVRIDNRVKWVWGGEFVHFVVHKENCDTMDAAAAIADRLRLNLKPSMLGYAGTKDRRAKTSQWFSARKLDPRKLAAACANLRGVHVGDYRFADHQLKLGMLKGNRFRICLRNVTAEERCVEEACSNLAERGFINYYGLQRFGVRVEVPTYTVGLKLLQGNLKEAIELILTPREGPLQAALEALGGGAPPGAAANMLPPGRGGGAEVRLIRALARCPNDYYGAINDIPRNTRLLYLHAYQSLVWNRAVSERLRRFGLRPAAGDLVPGDCAPDHEEVIDYVEDDEETSEAQSEQDGDDTQNDGDHDAAKIVTDESNVSANRPPGSNENPKIPVRILTEEDVDSGRYTIFDIIMPLPGYSVEYPPNMKEFYENYLQKDGLRLELRHKIRSFCMSGAYRRVVARPLELQWRWARYSDPYLDLIASDLDELHGSLPTGALQDGKYKALLLTMSLSSSCYATMALRELLKVDTSSDNQALQNNYHKRKQAPTGNTESTEASKNEEEPVEAKKVKTEDEES